VFVLFRKENVGKNIVIGGGFLNRELLQKQVMKSIDV